LRIGQRPIDWDVTNTRPSEAIISPFFERRPSLLPLEAERGETKDGAKTISDHGRFIEGSFIGCLTR